MKKTISLLITVLILVFSAVNVYAVEADITQSGKTVVNYGDWVIEKINGDTQWELDEYVGTDTEINTPRFIDNMLVVQYGSYCFANNETVKSVVTSSPLWVIDDYAFTNCIRLESFEFNYALHTIGVGAFSGTASLKDINLEESVVKSISAFAFADSGLEEVSLPSTCLSIDRYAFLRCTSLRKISIPDSVTEIADNAFEDCDNLVIYADKGSYAIEYAQANGIDYVTPTEKITYIAGDSDGDGLVTVLDATKIQRVLASLESDEDEMVHLRGNVSGGGLSVIDATNIQRYLATIPVSVPIGVEVTVEVS